MTNKSVKISDEDILHLYKNGLALIDEEVAKAFKVKLKVCVWDRLIVLRATGMITWASQHGEPILKWDSHHDHLCRASQITLFGRKRLHKLQDERLQKQKRADRTLGVG